MLLSQAITEKITQNLNEGVIKAWLDSILPKFFSFFWCVVIALIVFIIGRKLIQWIVKVTVRNMERRSVEKGVVTFTRSVLLGALYICLAVLILNLFGVATTSIAAAVGTMGITAGLSLQGALSNFAGGVLILVLHPFVVGDYIKEDTHGNEGTVSEITIFYTYLRTIGEKIVVIPNGTLANASLTNFTKNDKRQLDLIFSIGYDDDIKKAKDVLSKIATEETRRIESEECHIFVSELAESSVNLGLRFYVPTDEYWAVRWDTIEKVKYEFDANGIHIPYNQLDVHTI